MESNNKIEKVPYAVVIVDMQPSYLNPLSRRIIKYQKKTIEKAREDGAKVIFLEMGSICGIENYESTVRELNIKEEDIVLKKRHCDGFKETNLEDILKDSGTKAVYLMGVYGSACVFDTALSAREKGFIPIILLRGTSDGCLTKDTMKELYGKYNMQYDRR